MKALALFLAIASAALAQTPPATSPASPTAGAKDPFTFEDMMKLRRVGAPQPSPDGKWVVFDCVDVDLAANTRTSHLWIVPAQGGESRRLNQTPNHEERPRFSPDGKRLIWTSKATDPPQIWMCDFDANAGALAGTPHQLTSLSTGADGGIWTGDGRNIVFVSAVYPDCKDDACNKQRDEELSKSKVKARIFTHLLYRHWNAFTEFKRSHLFVLSADTVGRDSVEPDVAANPGSTESRPIDSGARDLTPGDHDVPPFNLGGQDMYASSPDGQELAYTSNIDEVEATSTNNEIFIVPIAGGTPKKISTSPGSDSTPLYSPDGKYIAWRSQARAGFESDKQSVIVYERATQRSGNPTAKFDRSASSFTWSPDSQSIYLSAEDHGQSPIYRMSHTEAPVQIAATHADDLTFGAADRLFFTRQSIAAPNEIASIDVSQKADATAVTHMNDALLSQIDMQPMESFTFKGADDADVQGFIIKPPRFDSNKKYPLKFLIHGGPQGAWGNDWTYRWNPELFAAYGMRSTSIGRDSVEPDAAATSSAGAARSPSASTESRPTSNGYVVVMINPHGSTGYGQAFTDAVSRDWGGKPFVDLMKGLDYVEKTYPFIDKTREAALGASYGGYMINWMLGHTDRFKCVVSHDGMFNAESAYGTTEELWFMNWEWGGPPWQNRELYRKFSPHEHAQNFKTPTLVVHGQLDYRLDVSQGFDLFTTLQVRKVPSKMLYFPDEGHWVLKPQNSQLWYRTVNDWVDQWCR